jgi:hypothetical protein
MTKWAHLTHDAHGGYFLPPVLAEQKPRDSLLPPLEQTTEADAVVQKLQSSLQDDCITMGSFIR